MEYCEGSFSFELNDHWHPHELQDKKVNNIHELKTKTRSAHAFPVNNAIWRMQGAKVKCISLEQGVQFGEWVGRLQGRNKDNNTYIKIILVPKF